MKRSFEQDTMEYFRARSNYQITRFFILGTFTVSIGIPVGSLASSNIKAIHYLNMEIKQLEQFVDKLEKEKAANDKIIEQKKQDESLL